MWFLHYRSNFLVALLHYMVPQVLFSMSLEVSGQDKAAGQHLAKHLLPRASRSRLLTGLLLPKLWALAPRHGAAAGAHLRKIAVQSEEKLQQEQAYPKQILA